MTGLLAIGNDVVWLADPAIADHHQRPRFVDRVCDRMERLRLGVAADPRRLLWLLFAAKEAAYKVAVKLRPDTVFSPSRFAVNWGLTQVRYGDLVLRLRVAHGVDWVHAVASTVATVPLWTVARCPPDERESDAARNLARRAIAEHFDLPLDALAIDRPVDRCARDGLGPPQVRCGGQPVAIDLSLSHDGPFVACAAVAQVEG